jgi:hypothetical protein
MEVRVSINYDKTPKNARKMLLMVVVSLFLSVKKLEAISRPLIIIEKFSKISKVKVLRCSECAISDGSKAGQEAVLRVWLGCEILYLSLLSRCFCTDIFLSDASTRSNLKNASRSLLRAGISSFCAVSQRFGRSSNGG